LQSLAQLSEKTVMQTLAKIIESSKYSLKRLDAYWRAANYLAVGQICLLDNPLLKEPLLRSHVKPNRAGLWGTIPTQNFIYVHLNRVIQLFDLNMIFLTDSDNARPAVVGNAYLEGSYGELYPELTQDEAGLKKLFQQFSFPDGVPGNVSLDGPGSMCGGGLGYSLSHAFDAVSDNPELTAACVIGDGNSATGQLAKARHSIKFLNPKKDGAVLPIVLLNRNENPQTTFVARVTHREIRQFLYGLGWKPYFVEGDDPEEMHKRMASVVAKVVEEIQHIQTSARSNKDPKRPHWPVVLLNSPKNWTVPKFVNNQSVEGRSLADQVSSDDEHPGYLEKIESWLKSFRPKELFDETGKLMDELTALAPMGDRRMGANPDANRGRLLKNVIMPDCRAYVVNMDSSKNDSRKARERRFVCASLQGISPQIQL